MEQEFLEMLNVLSASFEGIRTQQIKAVIELSEEGNTVPFIARYRKEMTGSLDEVQIKDIWEGYQYLQNLKKRREEVLRLIDEQGKLTPELEKEILSATKLQRLEDLYRPYKQKKKTKAVIAREKGLQPLADFLLSGQQGSVLEKGEAFINEEKEILSAEDALLGAHEIIAEQVGDDASFREWIRKYMLRNGLLVSTLKDQEKDEQGTYEMYYDFNEKVHSSAPHRVLAINRGEREGVLKVVIQVDDEEITKLLSKQVIKNDEAESATYVEKGLQDGYKRFIKPAIERELRNELSERSEKQAIDIFGENLRNLLMQAPLKGKTVLGFDPAYRTGCKLAVVDPWGKLLTIDVIYPHHPAPQVKKDQAEPQFLALVKKYNVDIVAIGNGTASRESEQFVAQALKKSGTQTSFVIVNEAGASVYSASEEARQEFPDLQVEQRSAISIARRIQDPLAELVKIESKAVGVGQYQHDVNQKNLQAELDFVVERAVNQVGVNANTASVQLLEHIAGLNKTVATNLCRYREENGPFKNRTQIKKVPRLGPKAYEQAIGFLRIPDGSNPFDNTGIHPERYDFAKALLKEAKIKLSDETALKQQALQNTISTIDLSLYGVGQETTEDVVKALVQPGRDERESMSGPLLRSDVLTMEDIKVGMSMEGVVRNVVDFGAFVDIGVKQDGLVHLSKLAKKFVKHPTDIVSVGDIVTVWVIGIDLKKQRVQLSMVDPREQTS